MIDTDYISKIRHGVKMCIVDALELEIPVDSIGDDDPLFGPADEGGLELDSLAALEIFVALTQEFGFEAKEIEPEAFRTVSSLADYVAAELSPANAG